MNADEYRQMIVSYRNGAPVRLRRPGRRSSTASRIERTASWFYTHEGQQRAITLGIQRQPGTNTIAVADAVKALLPQFRLELPTSVHMDVLYDRSDTIRESYRDVQFTMVLTLGARDHGHLRVPAERARHGHPEPGAAVLDRRHVRGDVLLGYSLDNLSMMALILSVGFVVDDAIVMLENIYRHVEMGEDTADGLACWFSRDRVHHRVDDAVARGGVHPGAVHGRRARASLPRVLGHDLRRDSDLRRRVGDADADAVQPLPQALERARRGSAVAVRADQRVGVSAPAARLRPHAPDRAAVTGRPR